MYSSASVLGKHRTIQNQSQGNQIGVCWNLSSIRLPTGGTISIDYQRDTYYFAGMAKDTVQSAAGQPAYFAFPDVYNLELPTTTYSTTSGTATKYDWSKFYKLGTNTTMVGMKYADMMDGSNKSKNTAESSTFPKYETSSDNVVDDYPISTSNTSAYDLKTGDVVMVVYVLDEKVTNSTPAQTKYTGVLNFAIVTRSDNANGKRVKLRPLFNMDANKRFFYYPNLNVNDNGVASSVILYGDLYWSYYLVPIRSNNGKSFFGGDVAVSTLKLNDGFGKILTKGYSYDGYRKKADGTTVDNTETYSAGASWAMPDAYPKDMIERYWEPTEAIHKLRFDPWPVIANNPQPSITPDVTNPNARETPLTRFLNNAYKAESYPGGYYYPSAGVTYARGLERVLDGTNTAAGSTEYQFYNSAYPFMNDMAAFSSGNPIAHFMLNNQWTLGSNTLTAGIPGINGKLLRKRELSSSNKIVKSTETDYTRLVSVYTDGDPTHPAAARYLGALEQKTGFMISPATTPTYLNFFVPNA
jgi:hypothetical protein